MRTLPAACLVLATLTPSGAAADELETLARRLSKPEAARALPAFAAVDTTAALVAEALRPLAAPLPADDAGWAELVDRLREARQEILRRSESIGPAPSAFSDLPLALPSSAAVDGGVRVELDLAPARTLLALLASDATSAAQVEAQLRASESWPVFAALVEHRSQSFYPTPLSIELLALNLALAANTDPLTRLYVAVNPLAFLDLGEVRANLPRYLALVHQLDAGRTAIGGEVVRRLQPYLPADARLVRRVAVIFAWGADGWASGNVAGIDLEYFKDDLPRLLGVLTHETYHVAQTVLRSAPRAPAVKGPRASWQAAVESLYAEGTATHVAPPQALAAADRAARAARGRQLLGELAAAVAAGDEGAADRLLDEGRRGAGPFYWLGAAMSAAIERHRGPAAVAACLRDGAPQFLRSYQAAAAAGCGEALPAAWVETGGLARP